MLDRNREGAFDRAAMKIHDHHSLDCTGGDQVGDQRCSPVRARERGDVPRIAEVGNDGCQASRARAAASIGH